MLGDARDDAFVRAHTRVRGISPHEHETEIERERAGRRECLVSKRDAHSDESRFRSLISCISNERVQPSPLEHETPACRVAVRVARVYVRMYARRGSYFVSVRVGSFHRSTSARRVSIQRADFDL